MKKIVIITSKLVQDHEFIYPFYRMKEEGFNVDTFNGENKQTLGYFGTKIPPKEDDKIITLNDLDVKNYDVLILPGGVKSMEILRLNKKAIQIVKEFYDNKKIIAATCSAIMMLISAKIIKDKKVAGYYAWKDDVENAGGIFVDKPCVIDKNLVTSPHYKYVGDWMKGLLSLIK